MAATRKPKAGAKAKTPAKTATINKVKFTREELLAAANDLNETVDLGDAKIDVEDKNTQHLANEVEDVCGELVLADTVSDATWDLANRMGKGAKFEQEQEAAKTDEDEDEEEEETPAPKSKRSAKGAKSGKGTKGKGNTTRKPGVISTIISSLKAVKKGLTKEELLARLQKAFPERNPDSMKNTINVQVPSRINKEQDFSVQKDSKGRYHVA